MITEEEQQREEGLSKINSEVMDKLKEFENSFSSFYGMHEEGANANRMVRRDKKGSDVKGIFNSRSGETARATGTLADVWLRMATAADPYIMAKRLGLNNYGQPLSEVELFGVEQLLGRQLQVFKFKKELRRAFLSTALFGTCIVEEPWLKDPRTGLEGTGFMLRSLIQCFFNPSVYDIDFSDYIGFVDYFPESTIRWMAKSDPQMWDIGAVERALFEVKNSTKTFNSDAWSRIMTRKNRAGYVDVGQKMIEMVTYHGRLDTENPVLQQLWESLGRQSDINSTDWSVRCIGNQVVSIAPAPYGSWHTIVKTATHNQFELEPIGYGVARQGGIYQKELDGTQSMLNNLLLMATLNMWKMGRYGGLKQGNIPLTPLGIVKVDRVSELEPLRPQIEALAHGMNMMNQWREDFRNLVGAKSGLQAELTGATATESALTQAEGIRSAGVAVEILAESLCREHFETAHLNNLHLLDDGVWVQVSGAEKPLVLNKDSLPINVGFDVRLTTDKNFRPKRMQDLMAGIQLGSNVHNNTGDMNFLRPLAEEYYRGLDLDPRLLYERVPVKDQLLRAMQRSGGNEQMLNELAGEIAGANGPQAIQTSMSTPVGPVPTSPISPPVTV